MKHAITDYALYRWRYWIGYILGGTIVAAALVFAALYVPGGLRAGEMSSAVTSDSLSLSYLAPDAVINLPYHALQKLSQMTFGVSTLSIKLPSLLMAIVTLIALVQLLKEWFRANVAAITGFISVTLPLFLFVAQDGTPIMYGICVSTCLLLTATYTSRKTQPLALWKILFSTLFALNLYAPLGLYLNLALLSTMIFHPHVRHVFRSLDLNKIMLGIFFGVVAIVPLVYAVVQKPELIKTLFGIPTTAVSLADNARELATLLFGYSGMNQVYWPVPVLSIGASVLLGIGIYRFITFKYTARSYIVSIWLLCLLPLVLLNPQEFSYLITVISILFAFGISGLIRDWYSIFPRNPYARVFGLLPLGMIVIGLGTSNLVQYNSQYYYGQATTSSYSYDLRLLPRAIDQSRPTQKDAPLTLVVVPEQKDFYTLAARQYKNVSVATELPTSTKTIIVQSGVDRTGIKSTLSYVVTNRFSSDSARFYTYTAS